MDPRRSPHLAAAHIFTSLLGLLVGLVATGGASARAEGGDPAALRWTPHRAAVASVPPPTVGAAASAAGGQQAAAAEETAPARPPVGPPASVSLPGYVPAPPGAPRTDRGAAPQTGASAPGPWASDRRGSPVRVPSVSGMAAFLGRDFTRAPQATPPRSRAPGWTAAGGTRSGRPERLAMNADGIPSVMTQAQRAPTVDGLPSPTGETLRAQAPRLDGGYPAPDDATEILTMPGLGGGPSEGLLMEPEFASEFGGDIGLDAMAPQGPAYYHVESFFDDPYACEDDECMLPVWEQHGRICEWLRQFGRPYYGWRWYRDFTASAGVMSFTNTTDLGINGNYGTNEYINWSMPFWNAFGVGWQVGARATQSNFNPTVLDTPAGRLQTPSRNQVFVTTGFFTRAFEGRGLQGGAVYDYLQDSWFDNVDLAQLRTEVSYVWGYHELGFWGAYNIGEEQGLFGPVTRTTSETTTLDLYTAFYRLQFGDANEWKFYGGATGRGNGVVGSFVRAPMSSFWALEGTFTYIIPGKSQVIDVDGAGTNLTVASDAWNVGVNVVFYPAGRARRSLASPYRPLFEVADNGSMIRSIGR